VAAVFGVEALISLTGRRYIRNILDVRSGLKGVKGDQQSFI
jgi:hypothetical protein